MGILPARLLCLVVFTAVLSQFLGMLLAMFGVPNVVQPLRDGLLFVLALSAISKTDIFEARGFYITLMLCVLMVVINIGVAAMTDRHLAGLYYARLYLLPLIFAMAVRGLVMPASLPVVRALTRMVLWTGLFITVLAFAIFVAIEFSPNLLYSFLGVVAGEELATVWYIAGGTWMRMGLPATSPNALGLALAFYLLLVIPLLLRGGGLLPVNRGVCILAIVLALLAMLMSFSRSSWLALAVGGGLMFLLCRREWGLGGPGAILKISVTLATLLVLLVAALLYADAYSGGFIGRWIDLNVAGSDPSMQGHGDSFWHAVSVIDEYFWIGYPKGTVGSRAALFGGAMHNVENSILTLFFEMGVPLGMVYLALIASVLKGLWLHRSQWGVVAAFGLCAMFLPYVFEPEMIALFLFISVLLGRAMQLAEGAVPGRAPDAAPARRRGGPGKSFQATVFGA